MVVAPLEARVATVAREESLSERDAHRRIEEVESERRAALGALVPVVAHNIRNPLASIRATAQLVDDQATPAELAGALTAPVTPIW